MPQSLRERGHVHGRAWGTLWQRALQRREVSGTAPWEVEAGPRAGGGRDHTEAEEGMCTRTALTPRQRPAPTPCLLPPRQSHSHRERGTCSRRPQPHEEPGPHAARVRRRQAETAVPAYKAPSSNPAPSTFSARVLHALAATQGPGGSECPSQSGGGQLGPPDSRVGLQPPLTPVHRAPGAKGYNFSEGTGSVKRSDGQGGQYPPAGEEGRATVPGPP